ncbi:leucine-rich repeat-containing protein 56 isoform 1-T3 [Odontesthes bonariensis]|uniref:leucine-rich repeat-containing protein 56 n=1 Tax=Odontesthes bonariensis TaxID=219752 RepID=UPI003F58CF1E
MSYCLGSVAQEVRPGTARVLVTELSGSGYINPTPVTKHSEDSDTEVELYLSPERLELLCGTRDLSHVTSLEVCVHTQEDTLGNFGAYLPRLLQLRMNNSLITSVRDLGTTLSNLQVLSMSRCCLKDLDGISTFTSLKELYVAYNNVSDLSQVGMLENLQQLDLEGNDVDDLVQVQYLGLCLKLQTLTLEGNPVCLRPNPTSTRVEDYSYRAAVRELVPQLRYLDDGKVEEDRLPCCSNIGEDWDILRNSIKESSSSKGASKDEDTADSGCPYSSHTSAMHPSSSPSYVRPMSSSGSRPMSATRSGILSPPGSRSGSSDSDLAAVEAETSILTHGAGKILFCGNPVQAIRARREKLRTAPTRSTFTHRDLPIHVPEHTFDLEEPDLGERTNVFAELRAWSEQHSRRLQAIEKERLPQILAINHSGEEETGGDEEEDSMQSNSGDEEQEEEKRSENLNTASLDSSLQSLSPADCSLKISDLHQQEALLPDMTRLLLSPDTTLSPPLSVTAAPVNGKLPGIRARRLRLSHVNPEHLPDFRGKGWAPGTLKAAAGTDLIFQRVQQRTRTSVPPLSLSAHVPHPPPTSTRERLKNSCVDLDWSRVHSDHKKKKSKIPGSPVLSRPHTARAALQKHHQHHLLQPCRGSSQPD